MSDQPRPCGAEGARRRLVFGDDESEAADVAWLWICEHDWAGWCIDVLTAHFTLPGDPASGPGNAEPKPWRPTHPRRRMGSAGAGPLRHLVARSDPRIVLGDQSAADLIVIGHRGRGLLKAMSVGSTAEWLLHRPPAPLAIIRSARPAHRILLCVDGSDDARAATETLAGFSWIPGREVIVLSVSDGRTDPRHAITDAVAVLEAAGARTYPCRREALRHSSAFDVRATILDVVSQRDPDLVALGTRGLGLGQRLLHGSVAAAVSHRASCSVLAVPSGAV